MTVNAYVKNIGGAITEKFGKYDVNLYTTDSKLAASLSLKKTEKRVADGIKSLCRPGNLAFKGNGVKITFSSTKPRWDNTHIIDGSREGRGWVDNTFRKFPDWAIIEFGKTVPIGRAELFCTEITDADFQIKQSGKWKTVAKFKRVSPLQMTANFSPALRPGSQHSNKDALEFIRCGLDMIEKLGIDLKTILVRLDSAHDCAEIIEELMKRGAAFIIKRNLRKELKEWWLSLARRVGESQSSREGKTVFTGEVSHIKVAGREDLAPVFATFEVTERTIDKHGQKLLIPDVEVNTFWTTLPVEAQTLIGLYHSHGTSEQYHSELKSDLDFERLASGKFATNSLLLLLVMLAFNALRILGQSALKMKDALPRRFKVQRRRLRSVMQDLIYIACKRPRYSGAIFFKFGRRCLWSYVFRQSHAMYC